MKRDAQCYQEYHFKTARELLDYLNPLEEERWLFNQNLFRGQPDAVHSLVPSAQRPEGNITAARFYGDQDVTTSQQVRFEKSILDAFITACDKSGLCIPGDNAQLRSYLKNSTYEGTDSTWPPLEIYPLLAFAQHHGVPTALLDWSRHPYVAAYFAASAALANIKDKEEELEGNLAVWAISRTVDQVEFVDAPGGTSPYLAAQSGEFTLIKIKDPNDQLFLHSGLEEHACLFTGKGAPFLLQKFTLPKSKAKDLLKACSLLGFSGPTLFPGFEGISIGVRDWARTNHRWPGLYENSVRFLIGG